MLEKTVVTDISFVQLPHTTKAQKTTPVRMEYLHAFDVDDQTNAQTTLIRAASRVECSPEMATCSLNGV